MAIQNSREPREYLERYPRICAHIIAESLGYATPMAAATILRDGIQGKPNYSEWIYSCFDSNAREAVEKAIRDRHSHVGYMTWYERAFQIVRNEVESGDGPTFASWF